MTPVINGDIAAGSCTSGVGSNVLPRQCQTPDAGRYYPVLLQCPELRKLCHPDSGGSIDFYLPAAPLHCSHLLIASSWIVLMAILK